MTNPQALTGWCMSFPKVRYYVYLWLCLSHIAGSIRNILNSFVDGPHEWNLFLKPTKTYHLVHWKTWHISLSLFCRAPSASCGPMKSSYPQMDNWTPNWTSHFLCRFVFHPMQEEWSQSQIRPVLWLSACVCQLSIIPDWAMWTFLHVGSLMLQYLALVLSREVTLWPLNAFLGKYSPQQHRQYDGRRVMCHSLHYNFHLLILHRDIIWSLRCSMAAI